MELLLTAVVFLLVLGVLYWLASQFLPHPVPLIVLAVGVIIMLFWLVGNVGELDTGNNSR